MNITSCLNKKYIVLAEKHGSKENISLTEEILKHLAGSKVVVAYEWSPLKNFRYTDDGRYSEEHEQFAYKLKKQGIPILKIDSATENTEWNERDRRMAECVLSEAEKYDHVLLVIGSLHARSVPFWREEKEFRPLVSYLEKGDICRIGIFYKRGFLYNFGRRDAQDFTYDDDYDMTFEVEHSTPVTPIEKSRSV